MIRCFLITLLLFFTMALTAQDTVNITDEKGLRQGFWNKKDSTGSVVYVGWFRDGVPSGEFRYFYPDGKVKTVSRFSNQGKRAETVSYFPGGQKMAAGVYLNEKKDSLWQFFSESNGTVVSQAFYVSGLIHGESKVFYPDGGISELLHYKNGVKDGLWEQYFTDGKIKLRGYYLDGNKTGLFQTFFLNGQLMLTGQYNAGHQDGRWRYYTEKGELVKTEVYSMGTLISSDPPAK
jgi:antitoxin component YwqK of YwqJK toxin-antitoxin module